MAPKNAPEPWDARPKKYASKLGNFVGKKQASASRTAKQQAAVRAKPPSPQHTVDEAAFQTTHQSTLKAQDATYSLFSSAWWPSVVSDAAKQHTKASKGPGMAGRRHLAALFKALLAACLVLSRPLPWDPVWLGLSPTTADATTSASVVAAFGDLDKPAFGTLFRKQSAALSSPDDPPAVSDAEIDIFDRWQGALVRSTFNQLHALHARVASIAWAILHNRAVLSLTIL